MRKNATACTALERNRHEAPRHHLDRSSRFYSGFFVPVRFARQRRSRPMKNWPNLTLWLIWQALIAIFFAALAGIIAGLLPFNT